MSRIVAERYFTVAGEMPKTTPDRDRNYRSRCPSVRTRLSFPSS